MKTIGSTLPNPTNSEIISNNRCIQSILSQVFQNFGKYPKDSACFLLRPLCYLNFANALYSGHNFTGIFTFAENLTFTICHTVFDNFPEPQKIKLILYLIIVHITCVEDTGSLESTYTSFSNDSSLSSFLAISPLISGRAKERNRMSHYQNQRNSL